MIDQHIHNSFKSPSGVVANTYLKNLLSAGIKISVNDAACTYSSYVQIRFPKSKKKRIRAKWAKDPRNYGSRTFHRSICIGNNLFVSTAVYNKLYSIRSPVFHECVSLIWDDEKELIIQLQENGIELIYEEGDYPVAILPDSGRELEVKIGLLSRIMKIKKDKYSEVINALKK